MVTRRRQPWRRVRRTVAAVAASVALLALAACAGTSAPDAAHSAGTAHPAAAHLHRGTVTDISTIGIRSFTETPGTVHVTANQHYVAGGDRRQSLDVCAPTASSSTPRPAVLSIHGGSWTRGDKANSDWRKVCVWLASEGFVAYSIDYRMVPQVHFPVPLEDVRAALRWIRRPAQVARFGIDPKRIGVFGGSAGGNLAALLALSGRGPTDRGDRVAALAELSGPVNLTAAGQVKGENPRLPAIEKAYLGCHELSPCPSVVAASPVFDVDPSDPPTFIGESSDELVPHSQGDGLAAALRAAKVPVEVQLKPGTRHSIALLDENMRSSVAAFLHQYLGS